MLKLCLNGKESFPGVVYQRKRVSIVRCDDQIEFCSVKSIQVCLFVSNKHFYTCKGTSVEMSKILLNNKHRCNKLCNLWELISNLRGINVLFFYRNFYVQDTMRDKSIEI